MTKLDQHPRVIQLAKELGLEGQGNWMGQIQQYARAEVEAFLRSAPVPISSLDILLLFLAERLNVKIEYLRSNDDLERISREYNVSDAQGRKLRQDMDDPGTDGLLTYNPDRRPGSRHYLAIVDARGGNAVRAYFTAWHELTHLIVTPPQRAFEGLYRMVSVTRDKDPEESVVDAVAGELAFYEPFVSPVLAEKEAETGGLTFSVVDGVREAVAPEASFFATAVACIKLTRQPALLLQIREDFKTSQRRRVDSPQAEMDLGSAAPAPIPKVRATRVISTVSARKYGLSIFRNMRIPEDSVLYQAHQSLADVELVAVENQGWWETNDGGHRPELRIRVEAVRIGSYVYGLVTPE